MATGGDPLWHEIVAAFIASGTDHEALRRSDGSPAPPILCVSGVIGAGKSTAINALRNTQGVTVVPEPVLLWEKMRGTDSLPKRNLLMWWDQEREQRALAMQFTTMITRTTEFEKAILRCGPETRYMLAERSVFDDMVFAVTALRDRPEDLSHYLVVAQAMRRIPLPAHIVHLQTPITDCVDNIHVRNRAGEEATSSEYLRALERETLAMHAALIAAGIKITYLDNPHDEQLRVQADAQVSARTDVFSANVVTPIRQLMVAQA